MQNKNQQPVSENARAEPVDVTSAMISAGVNAWEACHQSADEYFLVVSVYTAMARAKSQGSRPVSPLRGIGRR
jgi:hypothetical protein